MTCTYLRCPSDADGWAYLGGRWRLYCCDHLAGAARAGAVLAGPDAALDTEPLPPRARAMETEVRTHPGSTPVPCDPPRQPRRAVDVAFDTMVRPVAHVGPRLRGPPVPTGERTPGRCLCCPRQARGRMRHLCSGCYRRAVRHDCLDAVADPPVPHTARRRAA